MSYDGDDAYGYGYGYGYEDTDPNLTTNILRPSPQHHHTNDEISSNIFQPAAPQYPTFDEKTGSHIDRNIPPITPTTEPLRRSRWGDSNGHQPINMPTDQIPPPPPQRPDAPNFGVGGVQAILMNRNNHNNTTNSNNDANFNDNNRHNRNSFHNNARNHQQYGTGFQNTNNSTTHDQFDLNCGQTSHFNSNMNDGSQGYNGGNRWGDNDHPRHDNRQHNSTFNYNSHNTHQNTDATDNHLHHVSDENPGNFVPVHPSRAPLRPTSYTNTTKDPHHPSSGAIRAPPRPAAFGTTNNDPQNPRGNRYGNKPREDNGSRFNNSAHIGERRGGGYSNRTDLNGRTQIEVEDLLRNFWGPDDVIDDTPLAAAVMIPSHTDPLNERGDKSEKKDKRDKKDKSDYDEKRGKKDKNEKRFRNYDDYDEDEYHRSRYRDYRREKEDSRDSPDRYGSRRHHESYRRENYDSCDKKHHDYDGVKPEKGDAFKSDEKSSKIDSSAPILSLSALMNTYHQEIPHNTMNTMDSSSDDEYGPTSESIAIAAQRMREAQESAQNDSFLTTGGANAGDYGKGLLPGEGQALASYVQQGVRIPRRGEIGLEPHQIKHFEDTGFVMSGSRHVRMNAVRERKESQIYTAEQQHLNQVMKIQESKKKEEDFFAHLLNITDANLKK